MNPAKPKAWVRVTVPCAEDAREAVSNYLFENGATGLEEFDGEVTGYFPEPASAEKLDGLIRPYIHSLRQMGLEVSAPEFETVPFEDWARKWRESFGPIQVTDRIHIRPPWIEDPGPPDGVTLRIMPRMAFGTGSHETTQLCLELLETLVRPGQTVLDVGAGSGVLAIAAVRLGAEKAVGVDIEPEAAANAEENARLNGVQDAVRFHCGEAASLPELKADVIVANINRTVLERILPDLSRFAHADTRFILSGILESEFGRMLRFLMRRGFEVLETRRKGEWTGLVVRSSS